MSEETELALGLLTLSFVLLALMAFWFPIALKLAVLSDEEYCYTTEE